MTTSPSTPAHDRAKPAVLWVLPGVVVAASVCCAVVAHYVGHRTGGHDSWPYAVLVGGGGLVGFVVLAIAVSVIGWIPDRRRARNELGAATPVVVIFTIALLAVAGLVIDGGYALGAKREAMNDAEQAARVGADALNTGALRDGETKVDPGHAVTAAEAYLNSVGAHGTVSVNGGQVTVTVTGQQDTKLLSAVGVTKIPVKATATALSIDQDD